MKLFDSSSNRINMHTIGTFSVSKDNDIMVNTLIIDGIYE
jgi:hypothetical protein